MGLVLGRPQRTQMTGLKARRAFFRPNILSGVRIGVRIRNVRRTFPDLDADCGQNWKVYGASIHEHRRRTRMKG